MGNRTNCVDAVELKLLFQCVRFFCRHYIKMPHRHGMSTKMLKRTLKHAGLKTSGRKAALTKRAKKAHLLGGGPAPLEQLGGGSGAAQTLAPALVGARRRRTRTRKHRFPYM